MTRIETSAESETPSAAAADLAINDRSRFGFEVGARLDEGGRTGVIHTPHGDIATPADLVGKKIGVQAGGNEILFKALLAANDIDEKDVTIVPVEYDPAPLVNKEVDGFVAYLTNEAILVASQGIETNSSGRPRGPTSPDTFVMALTLNHASHTTNVSPMEVQMSDHDGSPCTRWVRRSMTTTKTRS